MNICFRIAVKMLFISAVLGQPQVQNSSASEGNEPRVITLDQAFHIALEKNADYALSHKNESLAESRRRQARSAYFPQVSLQGAAIHMDHDPMFVFPEERSTYNVTGLPIPDLPPDYPLALNVVIPEKQIKLMDQNIFSAGVNFLYPIFTGGRISAVNQQASLGVHMAKQEVRKTRLQVEFDVTKMYYSLVLAKSLVAVGEENLAGMEAILDLTEDMYQEGAGGVNKTDFLQNQYMVEYLRSVMSQLRNNEIMARAGLTAVLGLDSGSILQPAEKSLPYQVTIVDSDAALKTAFNSNPDWITIHLAEEVMDEQITEARSATFPSLAVMGNVNQIFNSYDAGMVSDDDKSSWQIGLGLEIPLSAGILSRHKISEATIRKESLSVRKQQLQDGLDIQVKMLLSNIDALRIQKESLETAQKAASENCELTERAYRIEMAEAKEMIEAQIFESLMKAQYQKVLYDHLMAQAQLKLLVGEEGGR